MLTQRDMLHWAVAIAAFLPLGAGSITRAEVLGIDRGQEPVQSVQQMSMEMWMNEWMSVSKTPGGMLKISKFSEPIYFLISPISWTPKQGQEAYREVIVPTGFVTDFASIPTIFCTLMRPDGAYAYAAVVHDYLYWTQTRSREEADQIFKMAMEDFKVPALTVVAIYDAVRVGGKRDWNDNARKKAQGEKRILTRFPQDPLTKWSDWKQRPEVFTP